MAYVSMIKYNKRKDYLCRRKGLIMKNYKRILSLIMVVVIVAGLSLALAGCGDNETATYYLTNTTDRTFTVTLVKKVKNLQQWQNVGPGDTVEMNVEITKDVNVFKVFYSGQQSGRVELNPETYVDGGQYYIILYRTPGSTKDEYRLTPADGSYVPPEN